MPHQWCKQDFSLHGATHCMHTLWLFCRSCRFCRLSVILIDSCWYIRRIWISEWKVEKSRFLIQIQWNDTVLLRTVCRLAGDRERLLALFSFTSGPTSYVISEFASTFQLPVVSVSPAVDESLRLHQHHPGSRRPAPDERDDGEVLRHEVTAAFFIRPLYTAAVVDIIQHYQWQHVFYVFDDNDGTCRFNLCIHNITLSKWYLRLVPQILPRFYFLLETLITTQTDTYTCENMIDFQDFYKVVCDYCMLYKMLFLLQTKH